MAARNGSVALNNLVVSQVLHTKGVARLIASRDVQGKTYTVTVEVSGGFPDSMAVREDDTIDVALGFDQRVKA